MKTLLVVDSSGRSTRSITRRLTGRFAGHWKELVPDAAVVHREVGANPPPAVNEAWIAAAFREEAQRSSADREALAFSDEMIDELASADAVVFGVPMYNFAAPAQFKAYIDQIVRINRTFVFDPGASEPYLPLLASKPLVIITSAGDGAIHPGGELAHLNFLEPHLRTVFEFIGLRAPEFIRVGYDEFQDHRLRHSLEAAEGAVDEIVRRVANSVGFASCDAGTGVLSGVN